MKGERNVGQVERGTVKKWNDEKGYGFIQRENGAKDIFVHYSAIQMAGRKRLFVGESVEFEVESTEKGPQAQNVVRIK